MSSRRQEHQACPDIQPQLFHPLMMRSQQQQQLLIDWHHPAFACLGAAPASLVSCHAITLKALADQQFPLVQTNTVPSQSDQFRIA